MKEITTKILTHFGRAFGVLALCSLVTAGTAFAETITKTFEFGAGTASSRSNYRTFPVPCGVRVTAVVKYSRLGDVGAQFDVPIVIELREPAATAEEEGSARTLSATAKRTEQTATLEKPPNKDRGCNLPWIVRVRPSSGQSPVAIVGSITVKYDGGVAIRVDVAGGLLRLNKGDSVTKNVGPPEGFGQGDLIVRGTWNHALGPVPGPLPVKLKFELIDPSGRVVGSSEGYSENEINPCCSNRKVGFFIRVSSCFTGQWKIRITNNTNDDAMNIDAIVRHEVLCP